MRVIGASLKITEKCICLYICGGLFRKAHVHFLLLLPLPDFPIIDFSTTSELLVELLLQEVSWASKGEDYTYFENNTGNLLLVYLPAPISVTNPFECCVRIRSQVLDLSFALGT